MKNSDALRAWSRILTGHAPMMSIEITKECPLKCPGCYAYEPGHTSAGSLRDVADFRDQALVDKVLDLVRAQRPIHLSIVGGEPLVRYRELNVILPEISRMGVEVMLVTSAVRPIPIEWKEIQGLLLSVSIDGLQPDHDLRRAPATYSRILTNIAGHSITVHCTVTHQMTGEPDYFKRFLTFWSGQPEVKRIWFSLFTPQKGEQSVEILSSPERHRILDELASLRGDFPKMELSDAVIRGYRNPPPSPDQCIFAGTTMCVSSDIERRVSPCQFGGDPDCSQCGCMASAGLKAVGDFKIAGLVPLKTIFRASQSIGHINSNG
ncbi:MAG TPA: radical SAM protein [Blastocatellia bacterium]